MYPIMVDLTNRPVTIVGGGQVAFRKYQKLLAENAKITIISPSINERINLNKVNWIKAKYSKDLLADADLVLACTNDKNVNEQVYQAAYPHQLVNNTSDKYNSDFYNVATFKYDGYVYSISSLGKDPFATKKKRQALQNWLDK